LCHPVGAGFVKATRCGKAELSFGAAKLTVQGKVDPWRVMEETRKDGVTATLEGVPDTPPRQGAVFISFVSATLLVAGWITGTFFNLSNISTMLWFAAILAGGFCHSA